MANFKNQGEAWNSQFVLTDETDPTKRVTDDLSNIPTGITVNVDRMFGHRFEFIRGVNPTTNGAASAGWTRLGVISYKRWRVVDCGFYIPTSGASTVAEEAHFGLEGCDIASDDSDYFAKCVQDITAGKNWATGDMLSLINPSYLAIQDVETNAGTHIWTQGIGFNVWQTKQGAIACVKGNVASSTAQIIGWVLIEIGN